MNRIMITVCVTFEDGKQVTLTGEAVAISAVLYPRQLKFLHDISQIIKDYIKVAREVYGPK